MVSLGDESLTALLTEELRIRSRDLAFERALARRWSRHERRAASASSVWAPWAAISRSTSSRAVCRSRSGTWNRNGSTTSCATTPATAFDGTKTFEELAAALERPRRILMMIPAGKPVDQTIEKIRPLLEAGDVLIDGGNSWFEDTRAPRGGAARRRASTSSAAACRAARKARGTARRSCRADRPRRGTAIKDVLEAIAAQDRRRPVRDARRHRRRRALRQDGPQRHRVRRHAAHRRERGTCCAAASA